jgi:ABC-2 type transport system ATP-binding protein
MQTIIETYNLRKVYRTNIKKTGLSGAFSNLFHAEYSDKAAIDDLSFSMHEGESMACIGENGSGKSTLIKMLVGILKPTSGSVLAYGKDPIERKWGYHNKIGVVFGQKTGLWWDIPVIESYNAAQVIYRVDKADYKKMLDEIVDQLGLAPILSMPARMLSLGQRMKADIGMVFLHRPRVLFLDEPTIGLDINIKHTIRAFIRKMNREDGISVLLTSHDLDDIDQISDTVLVLSSGRLFFRGMLEELKRQYAFQKVVVVTGDKRNDIAELLPTASVTADSRRTRIIFDATRHTSEELLAAVSRCYAIEDITIQEPGIDHVVSQIYARGAAS